MLQFSIENFSRLVEADNRTLVIDGHLISSVDDKILEDIIFGHLPFVTGSAGATDAPTRQGTILSYLARLPVSALLEINLDKLQLSKEESLSYKEYAYYLNHTDVMLSPIIYQWLENYYKNNQQAVPLKKLLDASPLFQNKPHEVLKTVLILVSLGCISIHNPQNQHFSSRPDKTDVHLLCDNLAVASYLDYCITTRDYNISIENNGIYYNLDILNYSEAGAKDFLSRILSLQSCNSGFINLTLRHNSDGDDSRVRFNLFGAAKGLSVDMYENNFSSDDYRYTFSLTKTNYIMNLPAYKKYGMDIVDLSILSLLRIKNYTLGELTLKISNYTLREIHRGLFALVVLGLITVSKEEVAPPRPVQVEIPVSKEKPAATPAVQPYKSLLQKLMDKIKTK